MAETLSELESELEEQRQKCIDKIKEDFKQDLKDQGLEDQKKPSLLILARAASAKYMDKNIIEDDELSDVFLFKKHLNDMINARK